MRAVERKGGDPDPEAVTAWGFHLIAADHDPGRRRQRGAAGVFETLAGSQHRLLPDDAGAPHLLHLPTAIGNLPVPIAQLHRLQAAVLDADMIGPDVTILGWRGLVLEVERLYRDFDRSRDFRIHRRCSSLFVSARSPARADTEVDAYNVGWAPEAVKIAAPGPRARAPDRRRVGGIHPG